MTLDQQEVIEHQTIVAIVENVERAHAEVQEAFDTLKRAKTRLKATLGGNGNYHDIIPSKSYYGDAVFEKSDDCHKHITRNAWKYVLGVTGLNHYMTEKRQRELYQQIEDDSLPPLTVENIVGTLQGLAGKIDGLLLESVKEVFDWLRPHGDGTGALKTNHRFYVGRKAIVYGVDRGFHGGFRMNYHYEANLRGLGNVFSLLDGKGVLRYPDDLNTRFNSTMDEKNRGEVFEDQYFRMKCYRNGNLHIEFKRLDLLAKLNQMGGDGNLPGKEKD